MVYAAIIPPMPRPPVCAGLSPMRQIRSSIRLATRVKATMNISHGRMVTVPGIVLIADSISFTKITLLVIIKHMLANILHQPRKISSVLFDPPIAKARGAI